MNNNYFLLACLFFIPTALIAGEAELQEQCTPYRQEQAPLDKNYQNYPYADGLIWKVSKDGMTNTIYGSIHTQEQLATRFPPQVRLAILQSRFYLMEIIVNQESNAVFQNAMFYENGDSLEGQLDPELINLLGYQLTDYGYQKEDAKRIKPWAAFSTIGAPKLVRALTLDQVLMNFASSRNLDIIGIETMEELIDSFSSIPLFDQLIILADTICNRQKIIAETKNLVDMHMHDDMLGIVKFNDQPHQDEALFERYMQTMVYDRNNKILERILPYFKKGKTFVAIGALHLPGENGLLKLFDDEGFEVKSLK